MTFFDVAPVAILIIAILGAAATAVASWHRHDGRPGTWTTLAGALAIVLFFVLGGTQFSVAVAGAVLVWVGGAITPGGL